MNALIDQLDSVMPTAITGSVVRTEGMMAAVAGFPAPVGAVAEIERQAGPSIFGEVVGFRDALTLVFPYEAMSGVRRGNQVVMRRTSRFLRVGDQLLGRVIDAHGVTTDQFPEPSLPHRTSLDRTPPSALERPPIETPLTTGVRALDGLLTCGTGQRMGIFSGSGVGKSVLLGMMARNTSADVNVIAMIGERGREVNEFLARDLGEEGRRRSVVVVATSDQPAILRVQAAMTATAVAEYFRDQGKNVMLLMDSVTRFAMAQREIGLAAGEPPATRGYPPSVFSLLPKLIERAGRGPRGSITAFYAVLVEGDDTNEPVADAVRGLLDGHTILSREIASKGHFPAIDVLQSISRLMPIVVDEEHLQAVMTIREVMAAYQEHRDLISIGAYRAGADALVDTAIAMQDELNGFLRQAINEASSLEDSREALLRLAALCHAARTSPAAQTFTEPAEVNRQPDYENPTNAKASP
ncbi:MAG: FliI/YscN family ATPase [Pirellulaceae bacterium]|jgi:FliI/YscN family ATPase|nr:FliI/YscN family ATPase [Pirellulaceae bacterium]MDP6553566.1 FliI/YscN family ATPase [Pirellulaceae bacterium]